MPACANQATIRAATAPFPIPPFPVQAPRSGAPIRGPAKNPPQAAVGGNMPADIAEDPPAGSRIAFRCRCRRPGHERARANRATLSALLAPPLRSPRTDRAVSHPLPFPGQAPRSGAPIRGPGKNPPQATVGETSRHTSPKTRPLGPGSPSAGAAGVRDTSARVRTERPLAPSSPRPFIPPGQTAPSPTLFRSTDKRRAAARRSGAQRRIRRRRPSGGTCRQTRRRLARWVSDRLPLALQASGTRGAPRRRWFALTLPPARFIPPPAACHRAATGIP